MGGNTVPEEQQGIMGSGSNVNFDDLSIVGNTIIEEDALSLPGCLRDRYYTQMSGARRTAHLRCKRRPGPLRNRTSGMLYKTVSSQNINKARCNSIRELPRTSAPLVRSHSCESLRDYMRDEEDAKEAGLCSATWHQKVILACLFLANFLSFCSFALMATVFPKQADDRGISTTESGLVFGVYSLAQFLSAPLFGRLILSVGPKFVFLTGCFISGVATILFGLLEMFPYDHGPAVFLVFCFLLRIFQALGANAWSTAVFTIATYTFPDSPAAVMGFLETPVGLGLMSGPAISGVLYGVGGFKLPFLAMGCAMLLTFPLYYFILQDPEENYSNDEEISVFTLLKLPAVSIVCVSVFLAALLWIVFDPTLEPHLRRFDLTPSQIGLVFLLFSGCYALLAPPVGWLSDKMKDSTPLMILGYIILTGTFLLVGPSPLTGLDNYRRLWLNLVALVFVGVAMALICVPTYDKILDTIEKAGIEDAMAVNATVAGLWNSAYALGESIGPVVAGWLVDEIDFAWCMTVMALLSTLAGVMLLCLWLWEASCCCNCSSEGTFDEVTTEEERAPLLIN